MNVFPIKVKRYGNHVLFLYWQWIFSNVSRQSLNLWTFNTVQLPIFDLLKIAQLD